MLGICLSFLGLSMERQVQAQEAATAIDFSRDVQPILSENCYYCHGQDANQRQADLRLDVEAEAQAVFVAGDARDSDVYLRICSDDEDELMPPPDSNRKLSPAQVEIIKRWIDQGGTWGQHWAYAPIKQAGRDSDSAIDSFVESKLISLGRKISPSADRETLIRRVSLDVTGLPPAIEQIDAFIADESPDAYAKMVDRFLESPAYGERMAWVWLDAARYADTNGYQGDNERAMWPWRDWVVNSYNENMPFDQFSKWQLAGDLMPNATHEQILATAFNRNYPINGEGGRIAEENRVDYVMDMAETAGTVWMGLTFNCCRCHDHKYDQLTQDDYYSLFAFFNQTPINGGGGDPQTKPVLACPTDTQDRSRNVLVDKIKPAQQTVEDRQSELRAQQVVWESKQIELLSNPNVSADGNSESDAELLRTIRKPKLGRTPAESQTVEKVFFQSEASYTADVKRLEALQAKLRNLNKRIPNVMVMADVTQPRKSFRLNRGSYREPLNEVNARIPERFLSSENQAIENANRLDLANWLFDESNPLTGRVAANRIWEQFFGIGLVKTSEDFGVQGEAPSHPELLDWLAAEYRSSGWDTKHMLRTILNSRVYRQSSKSNPDLRKLDPNNRLMARASRFRMPAWMLRDQAWAASGRLVFDVGGKPVNSYQPQGVWEEASFGKKKYQLGTGDELYRRSIYTFWRRIAAPTMFFDNADRMTCSVKTFRTNTPLHALNTFNDEMFVEAARLLASKAMHADSKAGGRLDFVYRSVLSRRPDKAELEVLLQALAKTRAHFAVNSEAASIFVSLGASPVDADLKLEELASWTSLCLAVFNLDEALTRQ